MKHCSRIVTAAACSLILAASYAGVANGTEVTLHAVRHSKSVAGSSVSTADTFTAGATETMCFTATNGSPDLEFIDAIVLTFPVGWTAACNSQDPQDSSGYNTTLSCSSALNVLTYDNGTFAEGTWGFCADITAPIGAPVPSSVAWDISGDGVGSAPHDVSGSESMLPVELVSFTAE